MKDIHELRGILPGTYIAGIWRLTLGLYDEVERQTSVFQKKHHIHCPQGCGTCCEHFVPDLTEAEASLIAAYLLLVKEDLSLVEALRKHDGQTAPCPLYNAVSPFHCAVYPARGLICRLFGACASDNKLGQPVFRKCKFNSATDTPLSITPEQFAETPEAVPTMREFGIRLESIGDPNVKRPLAEAVLAALDQLRFIAAYRFSDPNDDDNGGAGPQIPNPTPVAS
ncbi:MAG: YkgJ family cysteine cluster protein [Sphaerochaetaceae bacterium]